jgi:hypothetical protein
VALRVASLLPEPRDVVAQIEGQEGRRFTVSPNPRGQLLPVGKALIGQPSTTVALQVMGSPDVEDGYLWPLILTGTSDDVLGTILELHAAMTTRAVSIDNGTVPQEQEPALLEEMQGMLQTERETLAIFDPTLAERLAADGPSAQAIRACPDPETVTRNLAAERKLALPIDRPGTALQFESDVLVRQARCDFDALQRPAR